MTFVQLQLKSYLCCLDKTTCCCVHTVHVILLPSLSFIVCTWNLSVKNSTYSKTKEAALTSLTKIPQPKTGKSNSQF